MTKRSATKISAGPSRRNGVDFAELLAHGRRRRRLLAAVVVAALIAVFMLVTGTEGAQLGLIPTLIALTAKKFFGSKKDDPDALGDHPAVAYIFKALTTGEMDEVGDVVAADFHAYANGSEVVDPAVGDGAAQFKQNIEFWRSTVPDLSVDLYDEVSQTDPDKTDSIAVRYVISGSLPAEGETIPFVIEAAAFVKVVDRKIAEWRVVVDETFLQEVRAAMGLSGE
jgi:hypothetical protein